MTSSTRMGVLALLWGSGFLRIKISLNEGLTPGWITFLRCALGAVVLLVLALGFAGVLVIFTPWGHGSGLMSLGALALLGASASYAVAFACMARHLAGRGTAPPALSAAQLLAATGLSTPALAAGGAGTVTWAGLLAVTVLGVLATGLTFHLNWAERTRPNKRTRPTKQARPNDPARSGPASAGPVGSVPVRSGATSPGPTGSGPAGRQPIGSTTNTGISRSVLSW
ncbi:hypothetical protein GTW71_18840 [Streptomyces sp. SID6041]|nr:hypothetical protein [Streptomyces sp. SID6041]